MKQQKKSKPTAHRYITAIVAVLIAVACYGIWLSGHDPNQKPDISAQSCAVDPVLLYNPCRPWIGSSSGSYPQASGDLISQLTFLNKRVNDPTVLTYPTKSISLTHKIDVAHIYQSPGNNLFSSEALKLINSTDYQYVMVNWKPMPSNSYHWADVNANNATEKAYVQAAANAVAALPAGKKIFLAPFHEPENDVSVNNCATNASGASMGSPTDYVNMWHYIHSVFDQTKDAGGQSASSHVLWVINFMGFSKWNCLIPQLWPGNNYVDWVAWDPYGSGPSDFDNSVGSLYKYMSQNSGGDHDYLSKKWALNEFGYGSGASTNFNDAGALQYWKDALKSINAGTWSLIKM